MISYEDKLRLEEIKKKFEDLKNLFDIEKSKKRVKELEEKMVKSDFWNDQNKAQKVSKESQHLKDQIAEFKKLQSIFDDIDVAIEFSDEDPSMEDQVQTLLIEAEKMTKSFELRMLLNGKYDEMV
jgi:peptide chain release factor 2